MPSITEYDASRQSLVTRMEVTARELDHMLGHVTDHLTRRLVDQLYAELLPVVRDAVLKSLDTARLAACVEGELQLALRNALNPQP